jgi:predicted ester cyclase
MRRLAAFAVAIILIAASGHVMVQGSELTEEERLNKELIEWVFAEGVNKHNPDAWDSVLADNYVRYCDAMPPRMQELHGTETMKQFLAEHFAAFPDWDEQIIQMVVEDDKVAIVSIGTGTMTGGMGPFKPTGKRVKITDIMVHRFKDGKIIESWVSWDNVNFMTQAGLTPVPSEEEGKQ